MKKTKFTKILALLTVLSMLISIVNMPILASVDSPTAAEQAGLKDGFTARPKLSMVYMREKTAEDTDASKIWDNYVEVDPADIPALTKGSIFYIGLKYTNFDQYKYATEDEGVFSLQTELLFDTKMLLPEPGIAKMKNYEDDSWKNATGKAAVSALDIANGFFPRITNTAFMAANEELYYSGFKKTANVFKQDEGNVNENMYVVGANLQYGDDGSYSGFTGSDAVVGIHAFKIIGEPKAGKSTEYLSINAKQAFPNLSFGTAGTTASLSYELTDPKYKDITDIENLDLFPVHYSVVYHNGEDTYNGTDSFTVNSTSKTVTDLAAAKQELGLADAEGNDIADANGKYFESWYYLDGETEKAFSDSTDVTTLTGTTGEDGNITIDVYAKTKQGYAVNFYNSKADITDDSKTPITKYVAPVADSKLAASEIPAAPSPAPEGKAFGGWKYDVTEGDTTTPTAFDENVSIPEAGLNVYADWVDQITINYDLNYTGATNPEAKTGFPSAQYTHPTDPTREGYKFLGWYTAATDGTKIEVTDETTFKTVGDMLTSDPKTAYAHWQKIVQIAYTKDLPASVAYNGAAQPLTVQIMDVTNEGAEPTDITSQFALNTDYKIVYKQGEDEVEPKNAGEYTVTFETVAGGKLAASDITIKSAPTEAKTYTITPFTLNVNVDKDSQQFVQETEGAKATPATITGAAPTGATLPTGYADADALNIVYKKWTPDNETDKTIMGDKLETIASDNITALGNYVIEVTSKSANYTIGEVDANTYPTAGEGVIYPEGTAGKNIKFEVLPNNPVADNIEVFKTGSTTAETLYDNTYKTEKTFVSGEQGVEDEYWLRVDKDTSSVDIKVTAGSSFTVKIGGEAVTLTGGSATKTVTGLTAAVNGSANDIEVEVSTPASTKKYIIHVQRLNAPEIKLNPGNTPYGLIERMGLLTENAWDADKIALAKTEFDKNNLFAGEYIPSDAPRFGAKLPKYSVEAWGEGTNIDRDATAIVIFNGKTFKDPGFTAKYSDGNDVPVENITREIKVHRMLTTGTKGVTQVTDPEADDAVETKSKLTYTGGASDMLFTDITGPSTADNPLNKIRPGIYQMKYSFTDVDGSVKTEIRNVVVLFENGETDFDLVYSGLDLNAVVSAVSISKDTIDGASDEVNALYKYRVMDTDADGVLSGLDLNSIVASVSISTPVPQYYPALPAE